MASKGTAEQGLLVSYPSGTGRQRPFGYGLIRNADLKVSGLSRLAG